MADQIRATPQNATLGAIANFLKQTYAPQRTQQMQGVMELLGVPALARTAERMSYGEPVTNINKANVPLLPADTAEAAMLAGPPLASLARRVGTNLVQTAPYVARDLAQSMTSPMRSYVVKPKGGNWLAGSVESSIEPMKTRVIGQDPASRLRDLDAAYAQNVEAGVAMDPAVFARERARLEPEVAMNRWLETKLGKYIKNEMATPEDPIRALAESWPARKQELLTGKDVQIAKARADMEKARAARGFTPEMMTSSQARIRDLEKERELIAAREGLHSEIGPTGYSLKGPRAMAGFPEEGMGVSPLAKTWEDRADTFINQLHASDLTRGYPEAVEANPWLAKVPPQTRVYEMLRGAEEDLGFTHLADELRNALNPSSGLPPELLLKYTDLEKKTVPDIVNQVADINAWRAVQKAEADAVRAMGPAVHTFKEYPEQGFKWVELRQPKETGKKVSREKTTSELEMADEGVETMSYEDIVDMVNDLARDEGIRPGTREFNEMLEDNIRMFGKKPDEVDESIKALEDALKYEGETMGHCVGGYCPDVVEGRSKIYSLRDKKGQPHVTIEVAPAQHLDYNKWFASQTEDMQNEIARRRIADKNYNVYETPEYLSARADLPPEIVQIKGKANRAPNPEYLPAVQDFIRSGNFGKIGDLQNAGLVDVQDPNALLRALGKVSPERNIDQAIDNFNTAIDSAPNAQRYMTLDELRDFLGGSAGPEGFAQGGQVRGYAEGGQVSGANFPTYDFDPARIDSIVGELHAMNAG